MKSSELAVLFDMDGVLVDSYRAHYESWLVVARREGLSMTEDQFAETFGRTSGEIIALLWGDRVPESRVDELDRAKEAAYRDIVAHDFPEMPGAGGLIDALTDAGARLAVGSSGPPENIELVLEKLGRADKFEAVVTGRDVNRGKPDPQVFQMAAERLGAQPRACAVIEDAAPGIQAARAAGMTSIGLVSTGRTADELADADLVVHALDELSPERIGQLVGSRCC